MCSFVPPTFALSTPTPLSCPLSLQTLCASPTSPIPGIHAVGNTTSHLPTIAISRRTLPYLHIVSIYLCISRRHMTVMVGWALKIICVSSVSATFISLWFSIFFKTLNSINSVKNLQEKMYKKKQRKKNIHWNGELAATSWINCESVESVELTVNRNEMEAGIFRIGPLCVFASGKALNVDVQVVSDRSSLSRPSFRAGWLLHGERCDACASLLG